MACLFNHLFKLTASKFWSIGPLWGPGDSTGDVTCEYPTRDQNSRKACPCHDVIQIGCKLTIYMLIFNRNIYLHFMSLLHINMTQVVEVLPRVRQELTYSALNIMVADVLVTQGARASATMILSMLNWVNSVPHVKVWYAMESLCQFQQL